MYNFATDSLFIICFNSLILVIYCGFSGGTRRDTECLFSFLHPVTFIQAAQHGYAGSRNPFP